jgi:glutamate--cysteine ligase catalytic subunit
MGLLRLGKPLTWEEAIPHLQYVREHGLLQFLHVYNAVKDICNDDLLWGDEIEYHIMRVDPVAKRVQIALRGAEVRKSTCAYAYEHEHARRSWRS